MREGAGGVEVGQPESGPTCLKMEAAACEGPDGSVHICCTAGGSVWGPGVILLWRKKMISPPSKEQFNSRPEDSWPLFSLEFFWHGTLTELRVSDVSLEMHRFIQLSAAAVNIKFTI